MSRSERFSSPCFVVVTSLLALAATGCREKAVTYYETPHEERTAAAAPAVGGMPAGVASAPAQPGGPQLEWDKPAAWAEQPASQMRLASYLFTAPDGTKADISVFVFPDAAGGLMANINRWRDQVGLAPVAEADIATTAEHVDIVGQHAWRVDFAGTPAGGAGVTRIVGAIVPVSGSAWFFKMMGPDAVVSSQRAAFDEMIASMRAVTPAPVSTPGAAVAPATPAGPVAPDATMPQDDVHAGLTPPMNNMAGNVPPPPSPAGFQFLAPAGWVEQPSTAFRVVNFQVPGNGVPAAEFYVTPLSGTAGGELANVNRWRGQLGLAPVDANDLAGLVTTVTGPAGTFRVFDIASTGPALKTGERARMLVAILMRGDTSWFFRLTGEVDHVAQQRGSFDAFLKSVSFDAAR